MCCLNRGVHSLHSALDVLGSKASFGSLVVGTFVSDELAWRSLDLLRLKSGLDAGLDARLIELRFSLQVSTARRGAQRRPVLPPAAPKVSVYVAACRTAREAAVVHDVAVVWWSLAIASRQRRPPEQRPTAAEREGAEQGGDNWGQEEGRRQDVQQQQRQQQRQGGEDGGDDGAGNREGGGQPASPQEQQVAASPAQQDAIEWQPDAAVLRQLNFSPELVTSRQPLMHQLLQAGSMQELRSLVAAMRASGELEQMIEASHAQHRAAQAPGSATPAIDPRHRPRKPGQVVGGLAPGSSGAGVLSPQAGFFAAGHPIEPATVGDAVQGQGQFEVGRHGRRHDKPFMGLVRDRAITLHPWRPMICTTVEGHSKPQPRSLTSCATAEEAAVARDLGWVWLWKRTGSLREKAALNFSLSSYAALGGSLLDDVVQLPSLEQLRAHLRSMRDSGRLLSLATSLMRAAGRPMTVDSPAAGAAPSSAGKRGRSAGGGRSGGRGTASASEGASEDELGEEEAAEEMLHLLHGDHSGHSGEAERSRRARRAEGSGLAGEEKEERSFASGSSSGYVSATSEDAGARDDSDDEDFKLGGKAGRRPARKRARASPPPASEVQQRQQQQQQRSEQQLLGVVEGTEEEVEGGGAGGSKYVGVQRIASSKNASKQWIPRPTVRVPREGRLASKQLTLCYCDTADEAAVARDVATIWSYQQQLRAVPRAAAASLVPMPRLNFSMAGFQAQPGLLDRLQSVDRTESVQALAKELRDSGELLRLAGVLSGGSLVDGDKGAALGAPAAPPSPRSDSGAASPQHGQGTPSTLLSPAAAPAHGWAHAAWPPAVAAAVTSTIAEPQPDWMPDCRYLSELAAANDQLQQRPLAGVPAAAVALGAYCFQRLLADSEELRDRAVQAGFFSSANGQLFMHASPGCPPLLAILCTCIHLGTQLIKGPRYDSQLQSMLSRATGEAATAEQASELEMRCLQKLNGRLGP
ncbi:hypothetical protein COHA_007461 [Chlorella ohadii]|uniref:Uncharacterized protein n=1 Tax=Chlorella ohadii TaxID=2649997 RepID=A0AAD5DIW9_9CHLO|nr:hypothetical protein COHA_007461 [Chlorella ohadii]